jgi:hypothetical protein
LTLFFTQLLLSSAHLTLRSQILTSRAGGVAQVGECLASMRPSVQNPSIAKKQTKKPKSNPHVKQFSYCENKSTASRKWLNIETD